MRIHWFSFTVHSSEAHGRALWKRHFFHSLGGLVSTERRGRGFDNIDLALSEAKFYYNPVGQKDKNGVLKQLEYYHIEIPGEACDCLVPIIFQDVCDDLQASGLRWTVKRIDLAFDNIPFSPVEFCHAIVRGYAVTLAKRESLSIVQSPFTTKKDGSSLGCDTCYIGSKDSQRLVRVYNERGFNRLEMVCKDERAHVVALDIFSYRYGFWEGVAKMHLVQYIRFTSEFSQWLDFCEGVESANIKISSARVVSLSRIEDWFERQVSVALSVWWEVWGEFTARDKLKHMLVKAERRDRSRYSAVLHLAGG
jgi:hypothetical protein